MRRETRRQSDNVAVISADDNDDAYAVRKRPCHTIASVIGNNFPRALTIRRKRTDVRYRTPCVVGRERSNETRPTNLRMNRSIMTRSLVRKRLVCLRLSDRPLDAKNPPQGRSINSKRPSKQGRLQDKPSSTAYEFFP